MVNSKPAWLCPKSLKEATSIQREMAQKVIEADQGLVVNRIAGVDTSHPWRQQKAPIHAAIALLATKDLAVIERRQASGLPAFPYVPGYLGFREVPVLLLAWQLLSQAPDLIFVDGHGVSHPRGFGIATQFGLAVERPTIGVAKTLLVGEPKGKLGSKRGARTDLIWRGKKIGMVLCTKENCRPVYVSVGHRITLESAVAWVLEATRPNRRQAEPIRHAHEEANRARRSFDLSEA